MAVTNEQSIAVTQAFRFLEHVWRQIDALRDTLEDQAKNAEQLTKLGIKIVQYKALAGYENDDSDWVGRSVLDAFEVHKARRRGRQIPILHGAFQISVAPRDPSVDEAFFPHVAILLAAACDSDPWECEEFQMNEQYLTTKSEPDDEFFWDRDKTDPTRWVARDPGDFYLARIVPLLELKNDQDARQKIIDPLFKEIDAMIRAIEEAVD